MPRKRITQRFPWLLPLRKKQRTLCFYLAMRFDANRYCAYQADALLPHLLFTSACPMRNTQTGFPMSYQENKIHNLKLAAKRIDRLIIAPGETFSFWNRVRGADRRTPYKDALTERDGTLIPAYGGGLCQLSNLLCWICLHTPLTITERHGHPKKDFPEPPSDAPMGVDAAVAEGWLDFKVKNETSVPLQLSITFDDTHIIGRVYAARPLQKTYQLVNRNLQYIQQADGVYEEVDVVQRITEAGRTIEKTVYRNRCQIAYPLPEGTRVITKGDCQNG